MGTSLSHSANFLVVGSGGASPGRIRAVYAFTGTTTKKYRCANQYERHQSVDEVPNKELAGVHLECNGRKVRLPHDGRDEWRQEVLDQRRDNCPEGATDPATATARSITLPRSKNCRNPFNIVVSFFVRARDVGSVFRYSERISEQIQVTSCARHWYILCHIARTLMS